MVAAVTKFGEELRLLKGNPYLETNSSKAFFKKQQKNHLYLKYLFSILSGAFLIYIFH